LRMQCSAREPTERSEGFQPSWDIGRGIGVHCAAATLVTGVHRCQQVADLRPAHFSDHNPVRTHSKGLSDEVGQGDHPGELSVCRPTLDPYHMRVTGRQLLRVLDDDDPLVRRYQCEECSKECRFAEPVPPLIRNASLASIMRDRSCAAPGVNEPEATQSSSEKLRPAGTRKEMQVPGDARVPSTAWTRLPSASLASTKGIASSKPAI
jgi:hypothetical protein